jgi:hypothetical protein
MHEPKPVWPTAVGVKNAKTDTAHYNLSVKSVHALLKCPVPLAQSAAPVGASARVFGIEPMHAPQWESNG